MSSFDLINNLKQNLKNAFLRNFLVLMSGTVIAQIITVSFAPILSRLYAPDIFGVLGLYLSAVSIIGSVATLRYEQALMLPKESSDSANLMMLSLLCVLLVSILTAIIGIPLKHQIGNLTNSPDLIPWMWMLPISVFFYGTYQTLNTWSTRQKQFQRASISQIVRSATMNCYQLTVGFLNPGAGGLVGGSIVGDTCATAALAGQVIKADSQLIVQSFNPRRMKQLAREYSDFPIYNGLQCLLNATSQSIPLIILVYYFGSTVGGLYFMSVRIIQMPMNLVLTSLRQVLFQKASEVYNQGGDTLKLFNKITMGLLALSIPPALIVFLFAPQLFSFVLGDAWFTAGQYASWLCLWLAIMFGNVPAVTFGQVYRKQSTLLWQDVFLLISRIAALVIGGMYFNSYNTVILYSLVGLAFNIYIIFWMWKYLHAVRVGQ